MSVIFGECLQMPGTVRDDARICRGCWDQMSVPIPIRGPLAVPFRIFGITQSKMNPNICTICERAFRRVKKHRHISATASILFADIRGYTRLSERMDPIELSNVISVFQDQCAQGIWAHDGIVNKQMGDGLMAIFNFPIKVERHAEAAMLASASTPAKSRSVSSQPPAAISLQLVAPSICQPGLKPRRGRARFWSRPRARRWHQLSRPAPRRVRSCSRASNTQCWLMF